MCLSMRLSCLRVTFEVSLNVWRGLLLRGPESCKFPVIGLKEGTVCSS